MGIDALFEQIKQDELEDSASSGFMKPTQYAKLRGMYAQQVYTAIRNKKLEAVICQCGSKVIDVAAADELFHKKVDDVE